MRLFAITALTLCLAPAAQSLQEPTEPDPVGDGPALAGASESAEPASDESGTEPGAAEPILAWVAQQSVPLESTDPEADTPGKDLAALAAALEGVRVVGLGEATHGTSEFFRFRHRLLRHLVREQGFRVLAFESHHSGSAAVDDYIRGGESTLDQAMAGLGMRIWRVEELAAMLRWLREYNRSADPAERVRFVGVDMQGAERPSQSVEAYLARVARLDSESAAAEAEFYAALRMAGEAVWQGETEALAGFAERVDSRLADFAFKRGRYVARSSVAEYERVLSDLRILAQFTRAFGGGEGGGPDARDRYMADNVLSILANEPTAKVALFAHNAHIQRGGLSYQDPTSFAAGEYLARDLGSAYYALGLVFGSGTFQALERKDDGQWQFVAYEIGPPPPSTVGWMFDASVAEDAFLDLRHGPRPAEVQAWLDLPRGLRWAGGYGVPANQGERWKVAGNAQPYQLSRSFDGLVYVDEMRRASPLP